MIAKALAILVILSAFTFPAASYAQSSQPLGTIISSEINGVQTAAQAVPSTSPAYKLLTQSLNYLNEAQSLYNKGNYTGAEYYLRLAMNESYEGVINAGGQPFTVPPGLNVSRKVAVDYAQRVESIAQNINNATLRNEVMLNVSSALSILNRGGNVSEVAHELGEARQLLGSANAEVHQYSRDKFAEHFEKDFMPKLYAKAGSLGNNTLAAFNASMMKQVKGFESENVSQIARHMEDFQDDIRGSFALSEGTVGVYGSLVYMNLSYPLPVIQIGNQTFTAYANVTFVRETGSVIGIINSTQAYGYILANAGSQVTVFPPSHDNESMVHVTLNDVGKLSSQPAGTVIYYVPVPGKLFSGFTNEQEFNMSSIGHMFGNLTAFNHDFSNHNGMMQDH